MLLGHRYYDPSTGRFLTRDPIQDGRNWYVYCENNPVSFADPSGLTVHLIYGNIGNVRWSVGIGYQYVDSYRRPFEDMRVYKQPDLRQVRFIMATANEGDIIAFWGHGDKDGPWVNSSEQVLYRALEEASRLRYMSGRGRLRRAMILSCFCLKHPMVVNVWLAIAEVVEGWTTSTDPFQNGGQVFPTVLDEEIVFNSRFRKDARTDPSPSSSLSLRGGPERFPAW